MPSEPRQRSSSWSYSNNSESLDNDLEMNNNRIVRKVSSIGPSSLRTIDEIE